MYSARAAALSTTKSANVFPAFAAACSIRKSWRGDAEEPRSMRWAAGTGVPFSGARSAFMVLRAADRGKPRLPAARPGLDGAEMDAHLRARLASRRNCQT